MDLKALCFKAILPGWNAHTDNWPLDFDSVTLRDDKWAVITSNSPDVDAIAHKFYVAPKKGSTAPQFRSKKIVTHIHVPNKIYDAFLEAKRLAREAVSQLAF